MRKKGLIVNYIIAFCILITLTFTLPRLMKGDPLQAIYGDEALIEMTPELKADIIKRFSLDLSIKDQFFSYCLSLIKGDLGFSYYYNAPVINIIMQSIPWTLLLTGLALLISSLIGVIMGIESGYRRNKMFDKSMLTLLVSINGFPDFFIGILLLIIFSISIGIFPLSGALTPYADKTGFFLISDILHHLTLPLIALVLVSMTRTYLITRNTMILTLEKPFILTAKAKGCNDRTIRYTHAGRNALLPVFTTFGLQLAHIVTGALFIEIVFSYPGVGFMLYNSLLSRDYPMIQGILLIVAIAVLGINFFIDLFYGKIDPRISYAY